MKGRVTLSDRKKNVPYHNQDIAQKSFFKNQVEGSIPYELFHSQIGIELPSIIETLDTDISGIKWVLKEPDNVYKLEGNLYLNVEYQATYRNDDIYRFFEYYFQLVQKHKDDIKKFVTVVIYTCKKPESNEVIASLDHGFNNFQIRPIFVREMKDSGRFKEIMGKIEQNPFEKLTQEELQFLIYNPFMEHNESIVDRAINVTMLASKIQDESTQVQLVGSVLTLFGKVMPEETFEQLYQEVINMSTAFERVFNTKVKEEAERIAKKEKIENARKAIRKYTANSMLNEEAEKNIMIILDLSPEEYKKIKNEVQNLSLIHI